LGLNCPSPFREFLNTAEVNTTRHIALFQVRFHKRAGSLVLTSRVEADSLSLDSGVRAFAPAIEGPVVQMANHRFLLRPARTLEVSRTDRLIPHISDFRREQQ
jgi:hypothetical protein